MTAEENFHCKVGSRVDPRTPKQVRDEWRGKPLVERLEGFANECDDAGGSMLLSAADIREAIAIIKDKELERLVTAWRDARAACVNLDWPKVRFDDPRISATWNAVKKAEMALLQHAIRSLP